MTLGNTPSVRLVRQNPANQVAVKLEIRSPTGGYADRVAAALVALARPARGAVLLDGGDGVFAVGLAHALRGAGATLRAFVPESTSIELRQSLKALGAKVELTPHEQGAAGALLRARAAGPVARDEWPQAFVQAATQLAAELDQAARADGERLTCVAAGEDTGALALALLALPSAPVVLALAVADERVVHRLAGLPNRADVPPGARAVVIDDAFGWRWRERLAREEGLLLSPAAAATVGLAVEHAQQNPGLRVDAIASDTGERFFSLKDTFA